MTIFHINKKGVPAPCTAKQGKCPLGANQSHFESLKEAQLYVDKKNKEEFEFLPKINKGNTKKRNKLDYKKATTIKDKEYIDKTLQLLKNEIEGTTYIEKCKSSKRLHDYKPIEQKTRHYEDDRNWKEEKILKHFGDGKLIGYYEVDHKVGKLNEEKYKKQIIGVLNNGRIIIYDFNHGRTVTTFVAHRARIESMMLLAGDIPNNSILGKFTENKKKADRLGLS